MASKKIVSSSSLAKKTIQAIRQDVFGTSPDLGIRTGDHVLKRTHVGPYVARYYLETIEASARKATPGYQSELEERRAKKALQLRRRGKGAPKKGSGKR
mmetsp:Transcript_17904/g.41427  ORF Transcript_17904/g.41427 Transcript_17904/m.41427 type:complete len:99 (-) Transcript_17904:271-567(-)